LSAKTAEKLGEFFRAFSGARTALLLLDYDGTLAPFRIDRFKASPYSAVRELLSRIQNPGPAGLKTRMAIISGRPAAEIAPLLGLDPPLEVWGLHGAERLYPDGRRELEDAPAAARPKLDELREQLRRDSFGGLFEDKPNAAVMHWRGVAPRKARQIEQSTRALFEPIASLEGVTLLEFEAGLELRVGRDKGGAVDAILKEEITGNGACCPVAFLGDDVTDEAAFRSVNSTSSPHLSALVRRVRRTTAADVWLKPPEELRKFLERWIAASRAVSEYT
jgi:trehalose 6-phosphate phosphatase